MKKYAKYIPVQTMERGDRFEVNHTFILEETHLPNNKFFYSISICRRTSIEYSWRTTMEEIQSKKIYWPAPPELTSKSTP